MSARLSTAKKIQFLQAPVASLWTLFSFSTGKVRVLTPLNITACLFLPLLFSVITVELLFRNMLPSITIYFTSPIHTFLCIIPSGGFTYRTYPHALGQLLRTIKWQYRRKIISNFQLAWTTCLKLTKRLLLATFHNYLSMHVSCSSGTTPILYYDTAVFHKSGEDDSISHLFWSLSSNPDILNWFSSVSY